MNVHARPVVAAICAALVNGRAYTNVLDHSRTGNVRISAKAEGDVVEAYDHGRDCHVAGTLPNEVYHHGDAAHIAFTRVGDTVTGYHHGDGTHFEAKVKGGEVNLFDHGPSQHFKFTVG